MGGTNSHVWFFTKASYSTSLALNQPEWFKALYTNTNSLGTASDKKEKVLIGGRWLVFALGYIGWIKIFLEKVYDNLEYLGSATSCWHVL